VHQTVIIKRSQAFDERKYQQRTVFFKFQLEVIGSKRHLEVTGSKLCIINGCCTLYTPKSPASISLLQDERKWVVNFNFSGHTSYFVDTVVLNKVIQLSYIKSSDSVRFTLKASSNQ